MEPREKLSFVVVDFECKFVADEEIRKQETDSKGSSVPGGDFVDRSCVVVKPVVQMIPAYLIIFE